MTDNGKIEHLYLQELLELASGGLSGAKATEPEKYVFDAAKFPRVVAKASKPPPKGTIQSILPAGMPASEVIQKVNREFESKTNITSS